MLIINDAYELVAALDSSLPPDIKRLLQVRCDLIDLATFVIVSPGDAIEAVEAAAGIPIITNLVDGSRFGETDFQPSAEWVADHGGLFEAPFILSDDGAGVVLIVPDADGVDTTLLALMRTYGERALGDDLSGAKSGRATSA